VRKVSKSVYITKLLLYFVKSELMLHVKSFISWNRKLRATSPDKHQCTCLGSVPNLNSQASSSISEGWKPPYHIRKQKQNVIRLNQLGDLLAKRLWMGFKSRLDCLHNRRHALACGYAFKNLHFVQYRYAY